MVSSTYSVARRTASESMSMADSTACSASSEYGGRRSEYGSRAGGAIENSTGELDIFPSGAFPGRIAQKRSRMICDDYWNPMVAMNLSAELSDRRLCLEKSLRCEGPQCKNYFRLDQLKLADKVGTAGANLVRGRISVSGRPVLHNVGNEYFLP